MTVHSMFVNGLVVMTKLSALNCSEISQGPCDVADSQRLLFFCGKKGEKLT